MPFIRNIWYVAAWVSELEKDRPIGRIVAGEPVAIWRKADGSITALEDRCPHRHAPLSMGRIEDGGLRCMYHGLRFSDEGRCLHVPASDTIPPNANIRVFPVVERDDWIWIWTGEPTAADPALIPQAFGLTNGKWVMREGAIDYAADYQLINDNLTDLSHLDFVHETTLGAATGSHWANEQPRIRPIDNGLLIERWFDDHVLSPGRPERSDTFNSYRYILPGLFLMTTRAYPAGTAQASGYGPPDDAIAPLFARVEQQAVTPVTQGRSRYMFASGVGARFASPELLDGMMGVVNAAFAEDKAMIEAQQRIWDMTPQDRPKAFIPQDKAPALFRRLIDQRIAAEQQVGFVSTA